MNVFHEWLEKKVILNHDWFGFFCPPAGYIFRIDSLRGSLTSSARSYTLQLHTLTNNTFVNLMINHDICGLYTSNPGYMLFS